MAKARARRAPPRTALDTNLVLSSLVFGSGALAALRESWQREEFTPLVSTETARELLRVLAYPKFGLSPEEQSDLLSDYLPFCETVRIPNPPPPTPRCRDPFDVPFLELAVAGKADFLVTGDEDLLVLESKLPCPVLEASRFLERLASGR